MSADLWYLIPLHRALEREARDAVVQVLTPHCSGKLALEAYPADQAISLSPKSASGNLAEVRRSLRDVSESHDIDLALQTHSERHAPYQLACFDMDSTLIEQEVMDEIAKAAGIGAHISAITESAMRGEITFKESFSKRLALLKGFPAEDLPRIAERLTFSPGAVSLIQALRKRGIKIAIFSGGFSYFAEGLQSAGLGEVDFIHSNQLEIIDGCLTGKITNPLVNEHRKASLIQEIANELGIPLSQTVAVGDGANDIPMLKLAGLGIAYHAKPIVRESTDFQLTHSPLDAALALLPVDSDPAGRTNDEQR